MTETRRRDIRRLEEFEAALEDLRGRLRAEQTA